MKRRQHFHRRPLPPFHGFDHHVFSFPVGFTHGYVLLRLRRTLFKLCINARPRWSVLEGGNLNASCLAASMWVTQPGSPCRHMVEIVQTAGNPVRELLVRQSVASALSGFKIGIVP